jgi:hypothetical protein
VAAQVWGVQGDDHDVSGTSPDLLVASRADVLLASVAWLDAPLLSRFTGKRILDERDLPG